MLATEFCFKLRILIAGLDCIGLCGVLRSRQHSIGYMGDSGRSDKLYKVGPTAF